MPAIALIETNDAIRRRIEVARPAGSATGAGPTVETDDGLPGAVSILPPCELVAVAGVEHAGVIRLDGGIERFHGVMVMARNGFVRLLAMPCANCHSE